MLKRWYSIKEIEVYLLCAILISKDTLQGQKTVVNLLKRETNMSFKSAKLGQLVFSESRQQLGN